MDVQGIPKDISGIFFELIHCMRLDEADFRMFYEGGIELLDEGRLDDAYKILDYTRDCSKGIDQRLNDYSTMYSSFAKGFIQKRNNMEIERSLKDKIADSVHKCLRKYKDDSLEQDIETMSANLGIHEYITKKIGTRE
ncbi:hypothetical protein GF336_02440 [Candidatus Woesearchaeota archaeon]|nr:hypothetical protein [Candidatus Woesearchaeota archaeon]